MGSLPTNRTVNGFAVSPVDPRVIYFATRDGLFKSPDAGVGLKPIGQGLKNMAAIAVSPKRPEEVYASTTDGVIFKSMDAGVTWSRQP